MWVPKDSPQGFRLLQSDTVAGYVVAGTSMTRAMQEDEVSLEMTISVPTISAPKTARASNTPRWHRLRATLAAVLVCAAIGGCTGEQFQKGYILPPGALEQIQIGASQDQVLIVMGTPSTVATLNGEVATRHRSTRDRHLFRQEPPGDPARQLRTEGRQDLRLHQPHHADIWPGNKLSHAAL